MKLISWNVNGFRAILKKGFEDFINTENPDVISLQEIKVIPEQLPDFKLKGYDLHWNPAQKKGYSGTAIFTKVKPSSVIKGLGKDEYDAEGRLIIADYDDFYLANTYVPNSQRGLMRLDFRLKWDEYLRNCLNSLTNEKPVILCGDLNVAHKEIDLANPQINHNNPGFTKDERNNLTKLIDMGFTDTFRHFCDQPHRYTWWSYYHNARTKNIGWRIDYFLASNPFLNNVKSARIHADIHGSDHCPVSIELK